MKKLLIILILFITSCAYVEVSDDTKVPNKITEQVKTLKPDTLYVVKSETFHYYYNSDKVLIEKYSSDPAEFRIGVITLFVFSFLFIVLLIFFFIELD
jgi:hypothetical protein